MDEEALETSERVLDDLAGDDAVAYAEVGALERRFVDVVAGADAVRSAADGVETGVWWRLFADGAADYRYVRTLADDHVDDQLERSKRGARVLDQSDPARYDELTVHRASHPGWARGRPSAAAPAEDVAGQVRSALSAAVGDRDVERTRATYREAHVECSLSTTTGSAVTTTLDRAAVEATVDPADGPKVTGHAGATTGGRFLERLPSTLSELVDDAAAAGGDAAAVEGGRTTVVLAPRAAAALFHHLSHLLEVDATYMGTSPLAVGDRVGPESLRVEDGVRPGSWAARAYDAEARPTEPTTLVEDGRVAGFVYDVAAAADEDAHPAGNVVPSLGYEQPPRIHARHLTVAPGGWSEAELLADAALVVERVGRPRYVDEAAATKRSSKFPPSTPYARDVGADTPEEFDDPSGAAEVRLPVVVGHRLSEGGRSGVVAGGAVVVSPSDLAAADGLGATTRTTTATCEKHRSTLPVSVTAPAVRLPARFEPGR